jgi:hypothetical protein
MRRRPLLALVPVSLAALLAGACARPSAADVGLDLRFPAGVLDQVTAMTLFVFDASLATCDAASGHVSAIPAGDAALRFAMSSTDCPTGDRWCTSFQLDKDGADRVFAMVATRAGATVAEGCATHRVDTSPLQVQIEAHRYVPPRCCGNGVLEPGEQCDTGVLGSCDGKAPTACSGMKEDSVCFCDCTAREILLSVDDPGPPALRNGAAGTKAHLALAYTPGGVNNPVMLRAAFESTDPTAVGGADVNLAFRREDLSTVEDPYPLSLQLRLPLTCADVTGAGIVKEQRAPAIAAASPDMVVVAYLSNEDTVGEDYDVRVSPQIADGCMDAKHCESDADCPTRCVVGKVCATSLKLNTTPGGCSDPRVAAATEGTTLVVWTRKSGVFGRVYRTDGALLPAGGEIVIAPGGSAARVAGTGAGFRVVYQGSGMGDHDGVYLVDVDVQGHVGAPVLVNTVTTGAQDQPDLAVLDDGSTLVVWHGGGDVRFQRFDPKGAPLLGDQDAPLNTSGQGAASEQRFPAAAGGSGFYLVAWESAGDDGKGDVLARFLGAAGGFAYNSVNGQGDEFVATDLERKSDRRKPAVALGAYAVVGWEDRDPGHPGVYVRRFPAPTAM